MTRLLAALLVLGTGCRAASLVLCARRGGYVLYGVERRDDWCCIDRSNGGACRWIWP